MDWSNRSYRIYSIPQDSDLGLEPCGKHKEWLNYKLYGQDRKVGNDIYIYSQGIQWKYDGRLEFGESNNKIN